MKNINEYKRRFYNLMESTLGDVRPLITEQAKVNFEDLIGKSVVLKPKAFLGVDDKWFKPELDKETFNRRDKSFYEYIQKTPVKGTISYVKSITSDKIIFDIKVFDDVIWDGMGRYWEVSLSYECGTNKFIGEMDNKTETSWFFAKTVKMEYTCVGFSDALEKRLPCGNYDFAKNDMGDNETPNTFA